MRKFGEILLDLEVLIDEMVDDHEVQLGDLLSLVKSHVDIHRPDAIEEYEDGSNPVDYYGPQEE